MARPTVLHQGFLIPNAADVANPAMAEPDRIDFNTMANTRWGVIEGCLVTVSSSSATITAGTALVNGQLVNVPGGQSAAVGSGGSQDRFDLLGVDTNGTLIVKGGEPAADPVFPDPPLNFTVLAAVFCPTGTSDYTNNVIDKRKFLPDSLLTKIAPDADLIVNRNGSGNLFGIDGKGVTTWEADTLLQRSGAETLRVTKHLLVDVSITAGGSILGDSLVVTKTVTGSNLRRGTTADTGTPADILQTSNGRVYVWQSGSWQEMATLQSATPVGSVLTSLAAPDVMGPLGWIPLDGRTISEAEAGALFSIPALQGYIQGSSPNRVMITPNATQRMLMGDFARAGQIGGSNQIALLLENMPQHKHNVGITPGGSLSLTGRTDRRGQHGHTVTGGTHGHNINDPGHKHRAMEGPNGTVGDVISLFWGGQNKIDALFNDRSHTYSVEPLQFTVPAYTNITVSSAGSEHPHNLSQEGDHDHIVTFEAVQGQPPSSTESMMGSGSPFNFTPAYLAVYVYVRS